MTEKCNLYTGKLRFRDIDFTFVFDKEELRLIPPDDKRNIVAWDWMMKPIANGAFTFADPIPVEEDFLVGKCNETENRIVFIPKRGSSLSLYNTVVYIELTAYVICEKGKDIIDRVEFTCPEINYIHPVNQAFSLLIDQHDYFEKGVVTLNTQNFDITTTEKRKFTVDGTEVNAYFAISRTVSTKIHEPPLSLESALIFEFNATNDFSFILRLWQIARKFVRFLCYRKNIFIPAIKLSAPYEGGKHERFATMFLLNQDREVETDTLQKGRYIKQVHILGCEGKILNDIAADNIYLRHLPETYRAGRRIDAARFVMITAAFEWEFRRLYPGGVKKTDAKIAAENSVFEEINKLVDSTSGKKKSIYKFLKKLVKSDSLQSEIIQIGKDFSEIIGKFGNRLYSLNGQELNYSEMGKRIADQRNHFAHGDLDKEFIGLSLLDLIYMEYLIYAMQLKHYGVADLGIQKSINELFKLNIAI